MNTPRKQSGFGGILYFVGIFSAGIYFVFASVQGDYGLFRRVRIDAEAAQLSAERDKLAAQIATLENRTLRMSDEFLDLDLLDAQARRTLGLVRSDEVVLH